VKFIKNKNIKEKKRNEMQREFHTVKKMMKTTQNAIVKLGLILGLF